MSSSGELQQQTDARLGETIHSARILDGPAVYILRRPGYGKTYATYATRYGSIDNCFRLPGGAEPVRVPDGVAHFLEHQMFAQEDGDAFEGFSALGASANAYTSYTSTNYLFSTTENFEPALMHLLGFVQSPHFTDAGTEKERGIIQQEIRMYDDNPGWRLRQHLHESLYQAHPFRIDIAGTVESVGHITTDILRQCYDTFYHPANMVVCVVGDVVPERVLELVQEALGRHRRGPWRAPERILPPEPTTIAARSTTDVMSVARPILAMGFKERQTPLRGRGQLRRDLLTDIGLEAIFGRSTARYANLYERGLIDSGFGAGYYGEETFGLSRIGGETDRPEELAQEILSAIEEARRDGISAEGCERQRRSKLGDFIREFNSPEGLGHVLGALYFNDVDLFAYREILEEVTPGAVQERIGEHLDPQFCASAVIRPLDARA